MSLIDNIRAAQIAAGEDLVIQHLQDMGLVSMAPKEPSNPWKEAVVEACVTACIDWDEHDPVGTVRELIAMEVQTALDPSVSAEPAGIRKQAIEEVLQVVEHINDNCRGAPAEQAEIVEAIRELLK